jgi:hypothetical protein
MNAEQCGHMYSHYTIQMSSNTSWLAREFKLTKTALYLEHHNQDSRSGHHTVGFEKIKQDGHIYKMLYGTEFVMQMKAF